MLWRPVCSVERHGEAPGRALATEPSGFVGCCTVAYKRGCVNIPRGVRPFLRLRAAGLWEVLP